MIAERLSHSWGERQIGPCISIANTHMTNAWQVGSHENASMLIESVTNLAFYINDVISIATSVQPSQKNDFSFAGASIRITSSATFPTPFSLIKRRPLLLFTQKNGTSTPNFQYYHIQTVAKGCTILSRVSFYSKSGGKYP
jgi:hypothetical protein